MAITTKSDKGLKESNFFNHHRFDNHSAWLDRELRNKRQLRGEPKGHGFAIPREPAPARKEKPFVTQEYSMTSGLLVTRRYAQRDTDFPLDCERSDPYHYPNHLNVHERYHYEDRRARSQHIDPRVRARDEIPRDRELREAVPEEMVQNMLAGRSAAKIQPDPNVMAIQFDPNVRPQRETVKQLNVDLSCVDLPRREQQLPVFTSFDQKRKDWTWCLGGKKPPPPPDHGDPKMHRTTSLPGTLSGHSHLAHQKGATPGPFHGTTFIPCEANTRMRGGTNAVNGFTGTYPNLEVKP
jgi:hypothetical protein